MVQAWWAAGLAVPALAVKSIVSGKNRQKLDQQESPRVEEGSDPTFLCERVCTSNRLLRRMGGLSKPLMPAQKLVRELSAQTSIKCQHGMMPV